MNASSYKTVFSKRLGALVAVGEHATSQGKANGASGPGASGAGEGAVSALAGIGYVAALSASFAFVSIAWAAPATTALPTGGTVVQGAASMSQTANQLNITQGSQRAAINWQSFNIGAAATVNVAQPNAQAVLLNRVVGQSPSQIFGKLQANGHVILVNPNGVLFGKDGSVNAGGFTASTLNISDANFMAGNMVYERNGSTAGIVNQGSITAAPGGYVALLGATVSNEGSIHTQGGSVVMGAGETIKVPVSGTGRIKLELTPAAINASVSNSGSIVTEGGQVYMQALALNRAAAQILQSGRIDTTGEQGGAVHLLADGGTIKVDGSITANSTGTDDKGQVRKGGDIVIGRDEDTGALAKATDVRGAQLESNKGFVETSGDYLKTDGVSVKAAQWLLDPSDITISSAVDSNVTGTSPGDITPTGGDGTSSVVSVSTIQTAINAGTSVTIKTTNASDTTGAGNITIASALAFNNQGIKDATLSLIADNGITQNSGASITTNAASAKLVNVSMTAGGKYQGIAAPSASSKGITLNSTISTNGDVTLVGTNSTTNPTVGGGSADVGVNIATGSNITGKSIYIEGKANNSFGIQSKSTLTATGDITLKGTSDNWVGVVTNGSITAGGVLTIEGYKTNATGYQGINIASAVKGASVSITGVSKDHYGVGVGAAGSVTSTTGDVYIKGTGTGVTAGNNAVGAQIQGAVTAANKVTIEATTSGVGGYQGMNIAATVQGKSVELTGVSDNERGVGLGSGVSVKATSGNVMIKGTSLIHNGVSVGNTNQALGATITATGNVTLDGTSGNASIAKTGRTGVIVWDNSSISAASIDIIGTADTQAGKVATGVEFQRYGNASSLKATNGDINITGTVTGNGGGSGVKTSISGWGAQAPMISASGNFTLRGNNRASTSNASAAIDLSSGMQVKAGGSIVVQAETKNEAVAAINISSSPYTAYNAGGTRTWGNALTGNTSLVATNGNVLIQANQGFIVLNNTIDPTLTSGSGSNVLTAKTEITGKNITIDNTGAGMLTGASNTVGSGSIDGTTGVISAGSGKATGTGINLADTRAITASGNLNIMGVSSGGGTGISSNAVLTAGGMVNLTGESVTGQGIFSAGAVKSNSASVSMIGRSTDAAGGAGVVTQGTVSAQTDIKLEGYSANTTNVQGLVVQNAVTSNAGDITVKGETKASNPGQRAVAITTNGTLSNGGLNVADGKTINIHANTLYIAPTASVNAGTGTVNIQTLTSGNEILIGGTTANDGMGSGLTSQKLGIDNTELNRITAGKLVIGDTSSAGKITVDAATTTLAQTGNITLQTGGNIAVNKALTIASNVDPLLSKTLTLNATGANSTITQAGSDAGITADKVEFLGNKATVTLEPTGTTANSINKIGTIAGNVKSFALVNNSNLTVGAVNGTGGLTTTDDIKLTSTSATGTALTINNKIESTHGNVSLVARTSESATPVGAPDAAVKSRALVKGENVTMDAQALSMSGRTLGYYGAGDGGKFTATKDLNLSGSSKNTGNGFYMYGGALSAGNALTITGTSTTQGVGFEKAGSGAPNIAVASANGTTITGTSIGLNDVTLTNAAGAVTFTATSGDISANTTNTLTQNGNGDVKLTTVGSGNITVPKIINNGTGNVVIAAGSDFAAGVGTGGQVQTVSGNTISQTNTTPGKTYIYSGSAANTGALGNLDSTLGALKIDGTATQNADTNVAYNASSLGIAGSTAPAQVMFREALTVDSTILAATTLGKTYGDSTTAASEVTTTLLAEAKAALKNNAANSGDNSTFTTGEANSNNRIVVSKAVVVDSLTGPSALTNGSNSLAATDFSSAGFLKAKQGAYKFAGFTSSKYNVTGVDVGVDVAKRNITIAATPTTVTFSGGTQTQAARTQTGAFLAGDQVVVTGGSASGTAVGTYNDGIAVAAAVADDLANYNVTVRNSSLTIAAAPVVPVIVPFIRPDAGNNAGSRVRTVSGFGGAGAATGVLDDKAVTESREVCSDVFPENCECQPSVIPSIEICFAPKSVAATKEEK